jgi:hypothetical protein
MYTFCDTSDDGSRFWVGDRLIIQRDGWGSSCAKAEIRSGKHDMKADMFQVRCFAVRMCANALMGLNLAIRTI